MILDGKKIADIHTDKLSNHIAEQNIAPRLVIILIGDDEASQVYTRNKKKLCEKIGGSCEIIRKPSDTSESECLHLIQTCNNDKTVNGILVQFPLPKQIDVQKVANTISPEKDVDCFTPKNISQLYYGATTGLLPATPKGIIHLLDAYDIKISGVNITIIGRSTIVGKPLQILLGNRNATVTLCHSRTTNIPKHLQSADIIISATGNPGIIQKKDVPKNVVLIDVGVIRNPDDTLRGDIQTSDFIDTHQITPVPKGIGPLTMAMLADNLYLATCMQLGIQPRNS